MASPGNPNQQPLFRPSANPNNMVPASASSAPYPTPSSSYPPPSGPYPFHHPQYLPYPPPPSHPQQEHQFFQHQPPQHHLHPPQRPGPFVAHPSPASPNPGGARLMALLGTQNPSPTPDLPPHPFTQSPSAPPEFLMSVRPPGQAPSAPPVNLLAGQPSPMRLLSTKLPKGRHLTGDHVVYDVDVRLPGEVQPQLEVTPITKYVSDPGLVLGRQIAVNRSYICYGLKMGNIRVLNINTALRSLLRGHTQRVTDMTFFAEDVHLLASASNDGRVFIWRINEGPDEEDKAQIAGKVVIAIQFVGEEESVHPQLCWHPHKQENLMVAIGKRILKIDTTRIRKAGGFSAEEPIKCPLEKLIDGVQLVGAHDDVVTNLSMCQWMTTRLASASLDGTVKIWEDRKQSPLATIRPHDGHPVNSVTFFTSPHRPDHIVLITGGPVNREVKIWSSTSEEGWLLPSDSESWQCNQTLELRSSSEAKVDDAFFNQVVALPRAGLVLLANAKKNAIYALHIDYGVNPAATRIDYMAEFTVTMPILSVTGTSESLADGDHIVQVYCVQTQAIQQYALALSQCLPPPLDHAEIEKTESAVSSMVDAASAEIPANMDIISYTEALTSNATPPLHSNTSAGITGLLETAVSPRKYDNIRAASPPLPLSPKISRLSSGFRSPPLTDNSSDQQGETLKKHENSADLPAVSGPVMFKHPTHLVTPSEILFRAPSSDTHITQGMTIGEVKVQDVAANPTVDSVEVEVKVVDSQNTGSDYERESNIIVSEKKEQSFYSQASSLSMQVSRHCSDDNYNTDGTGHVNAVDAADLSNHAPIGGDGAQDSSNSVSEKVGEAESSAAVQGQSTATKGKKKGKTSQVGPSSPSPSPFNSTDSFNVPEASSGLPSPDGALTHLSTMQEMLDQLVGMQREMQKQLNAVVSGPVNKEGKRLETSLGRSMERIMKANSDALWARFVEENAKQEKLERERTQNITNLIANFNKDLEKTIKKEINAVGPAVVRAITPVLEKSISSAITDSFQKGVGDKAVNQLEKAVNSKLEGTVARQIQVQFQTSGKQALQEGLRSGLDGSVIPSFELQCKAMFEQIDATFQNGLVNHLAAAQKQFDSAHSPLAIALRDTMNSALTMSQTLSGELADGQRKLIAIAGAAGGSNMSNPLVSQLSNGPLAGLREMQPEAPVDPTKELSRLIAERKYGEAFNAALQRSDVSIVSWLCSQVDLASILALVPIPLSQGVLLALLQQLACDISNDTARKLGWMTDVTVAINPADPMIVVHVRPIFEQVYQILGHQRGLPTRSAAEANSIRLLMHVINSVLMSCK